jgi:hypothetical protein
MSTPANMMKKMPMTAKRAPTDQYVCESTAFRRSSSSSSALGCSSGDLTAAFLGVVVRMRSRSVGGSAGAKRKRKSVAVQIGRIVATMIINASGDFRFRLIDIKPRACEVVMLATR